MNWLQQRLARLRENFWLLPLVIVLACGGLAILLTNVEIMAASRGQAWWSLVSGISAEGAREVMSTIAGSMMTVLGVTFSMILVVLSLASNQYTSRILRNYVRDRVTQVVLGAFSGIFTYCIMVLRAIRGGEEETVPHLSITFGLVLALAGVAAFVYFLHHVAASIEAANIVAAIASETEAVIVRLFPEPAGDAPGPAGPKVDAGVSGRLPGDVDAALSQDAPDEGEWQAAPAQCSGYIQSVNHDALLGLAGKWNTVIRLEHPIGDFVIQGMPLVSLLTGQPLDSEQVRSLQAAIPLSPHRTIEQDAAFGVRQIVDIALKALSPGINDTTTAITCVDYLTAILARMASRDVPSPHRQVDGKLRLIAEGIDFPELLGTAFNQIRASAAGNAAVQSRLATSLGILSGLVRQPDCRQALNEQAKWLGELAERTLEAPQDRRDMQEKLARLPRRPAL